MTSYLAKWGQAARIIFRIPPPFALLFSAFALFILIQAVRLFWIIASPIAPIGNWQPIYPQAMQAGARTELFAGFDPFFRNAPIEQSDSNSEIVTSLPLTLFGIRSNEASGGGSAIVADGTGVQQSFAVGDEVLPSVLLHAVAFDHVILRNNGKLEKLFLDQSVPAQNATPAAPGPVAASGPVAAPTPEINAPPGDIKLNPQKLASSIGFAPRVEGGKVTGLAVSAKDDGSVLRSAGLKTGDIILSVNGSPVRTPADLASQFQPGARLSVEVERGAQKTQIAIILEKQ